MWAPVAERLTARGQESIVPLLLDVADEGAPFLASCRGRRRRGNEPTPPRPEGRLVGHSNAGSFVRWSSRTLSGLCAAGCPSTRHCPRWPMCGVAVTTC
jgi:hypothetical protein